jgi:serine/threonine protein kinase
MEGSSRREHTTLYSRGTRSYRAPELVRLDQKSKYTNKVDMWAVGCILYELVLRRRAFADDWEVLQHAKSGKDYEVIIGPTSVADERRRAFLAKIIKELLNSDPSGRPNAQTLYERFISWGSDDVPKKLASKSLPSLNRRRFFAVKMTRRASKPSRPYSPALSTGSHTFKTPFLLPPSSVLKSTLEKDNPKTRVSTRIKSKKALTQ